MEQTYIFDAIAKERNRQDEKWGSIEDFHIDGKFRNTHYEWTAILTEEIGEAAHAVIEYMTGRHAGKDNLFKELIHCAAVIVAWLEDRF